MPLDNPAPGGNWANEFTVSPIPWVTSSVATGLVGYNFGFVTKTLLVKNTGGGGSIKVGFTALGVMSSSNYFSLAVGEGFGGDYRVKSLFISGSGNTFSLMAGLTGIQGRYFPELTGSSGFVAIG